MEPDETSFFDRRRFRRLRYLIAAGLVCFYFGKFFYGVVIEAYYLSQNGPVARSSSYLFGFDDLIVALISAAILISEFEVLTSPKTYHILRAVCIVVAVIAMIRGVFYLREIVHLLDYDYIEIGVVAFVIRQASIVFAAIYFYHRISIHSSEADNMHV